MRVSTIDKEIMSERAELKRAKRARKKFKKARKKSEYIGVKRFFAGLFLLGCVGIITGLTLLYGPWSNFREWLITTAMTTMSHQYFATWFYDEDVIADVLNRNKVVEINEDTNIAMINLNSNQTTEYENEYERAILEREPGNNDYKIIEINEKKFSGYLVAVYEPARIRAVCTRNLGVSGQYLTAMAEEHDALIAINGGGFDDPNFSSTGGSPLGITICNWEFASQAKYAGSGGIIGFTRDNKLILSSKVTKKEAQAKDIRDAVTFGPFLIVNGKKSSVVGNGGWGTAPRTAIAQRTDGIVLFLVVDGRTASQPGADMDDLIKVLLKYGAYNAANLDGGTSSVLVVNNTIVNDPIDSTGAHKTRPIASGIILTKDESDDGDHSVVADKLE